MERLTIIGRENRNLIYICPNGHINSKRKDYIKNAKILCKECLIYDLHDLFRQEGYKLLETRYERMNKKVKYKCPEGHYNFTTPTYFKQGYR